MRKKTHEEFVLEIKSISPNIEILETYINARQNINCNCLICGRKWSPTTTSLTTGRNCPKCAGKEKKTTDEFVSEMKVKNPNLEILGEYDGNKESIETLCLKCKHTWYPKPSDLLSGYGCPKCNESKGEKSISVFLENHEIKNTPQYKIEECKNIFVLPFDFAIFDKFDNLFCLIEYQGEQHYKPVKFGKMSDESSIKKYNQTVNRDKIKKDYCKNKGINLIEIPYWEFDNIEIILNKNLSDIL